MLSRCQIPHLSTLFFAGVTVNSVEPGIIYTSIMKNLSWLYRLSFWFLSFFLKVGRGEVNSAMFCVPCLL